MKIYGALEVGGTKMVVAIVNDEGSILERASIPTRNPDLTIPEIISFFKAFDIAALGIATFGPVNLNPKSSSYGNILKTPKKDWINYPLLQTLQNALHIPVGIDTDVNGSCLGEISFGDSKGLTDVIYITIGTGIGAGICSGGKMIHGMLHPEAGHILINTATGDEGNCICPYHTSCFEGLASGPAIEHRYKLPAYKLIDRSEIWELEADYIAKALVNYILILSPKRIILGGGVMHQTQLFPLIRKAVLDKLGGYITTPELSCIDTYIVPPSLSDNQGILGASILARQVIE